MRARKHPKRQSRLKTRGGISDPLHGFHPRLCEGLTRARGTFRVDPFTNRVEPKFQDHRKVPGRIPAPIFFDEVTGQDVVRTETIDHYGGRLKWMDPDHLARKHPA
jgi:hypothetical protein